jgi:tetratricopeptide (TPR) repeat protein
MSISSYYLHSFARKSSQNIQKNTGIYTWLIKTLNLKELAVGYLWMSFDNDTIYQLANHHRLLITLDAITSLKEDEFEAWSLKNFMRLDCAVKQDDEEMKARALNDYRLACELNPCQSKFWHDAAQTIYTRLKDPEMALTYARQSVKLPDAKVKSRRLLARIYYELGEEKKALKLYRKILSGAEAEAADKEIADRMVKVIEEQL